MILDTTNHKRVCRDEFRDDLSLFLDTLEEFKLMVLQRQHYSQCRLTEIDHITCPSCCIAYSADILGPQYGNEHISQFSGIETNIIQ